MIIYGTLYVDVKAMKVHYCDLFLAMNQWL